MATARITRQWDDSTVVVTEVDSDLDSLADVVAAIVELDAMVFPDGDD